MKEDTPNIPSSSRATVTYAIPQTVKAVRSPHRQRHVTCVCHIIIVPQQTASPPPTPVAAPTFPMAV